MRPLDPLAPASSLAHLLRSASAAHVRAEMARVEAIAEGPAAAAALLFARGALALRDGVNAAARADLTAAAHAFAALGENDAADVARCEALRATVLGGPPSAGAAAIAPLRAIAAAAPEGRVRVVALHVRGVAERAAGDVAAAQRTLLEALRGAEPFLEEHAQVLGTLGALFVELGAFGAAVAHLEHAALLHDESGDAAGEAAAHGELGVAARALGDLEGARRHLERQEWLASRLGDPLGRTRALTLLAGVALQAGRAADAAELAGLALEVPHAGDARTAPWVAHATAIAGDGRAWFAPAWALGSLGDVAHVASLLADRAAAGGVDRHEGFVLAALAPSAPRPAAAGEAARVSSGSETLVAVAARRAAAQRNLGRLAALSIAPPGLLLAAIASDSVGEANRALPPEHAAAAAVAELPGIAVWAWPASATPEAIAGDLAGARATLGEDTRAVLVLRPRARVLSPPFHGEVGAQVHGVDAVALVRAVSGLEEGELVRGVDVPWSEDAEGRVTAAGFVGKASRD